MNAPARRGLFISFEGGEGGGKTTQIALLADALRADGTPVLTTREPGGTKLGGKLRQILLGPSEDGRVAPAAEALLFAADRAQHVETVIRPALDAGTTVITDRYVDSSLAYQGAGNGHDVDQIAALSRYATGGLMPDITFLLDLDPVIGLARAGARATPDAIESLDIGFHLRLRRKFLDLAAADANRFVIIDTAAGVNEVAAHIKDTVHTRAVSHDDRWLTSVDDAFRDDSGGRR